MKAETEPRYIGPTSDSADIYISLNSYLKSKYSNSLGNRDRDLIARRVTADLSYRRGQKRELESAKRTRNIVLFCLGSGIAVAILTPIIDRFANPEKK